KRRQRPARLGDQPLDPLEPLLERHRLAESHALDGMSRQRRNTGGKLKYARQEAETARGKIDHIGHVVSPKREGARQFVFTSVGVLSLRQVCPQPRPLIKNSSPGRKRRTLGLPDRPRNGGDRRPNLFRRVIAAEAEAYALAAHVGDDVGAREPSVERLRARQFES